MEYHSLSDQIRGSYAFINTVQIMEIGETIYFVSYEYTFIYDNEGIRVEEQPGNFGVGYPKKGITFSSLEHGLVIQNKHGLEIFN